MVKKTLVNKKVVRALTIALSTTLAAQPLTAAAAEIPVTPSPVTPATPADQTGVADDAQEAAETAEAAVETADTKKDILVNAVDNVSVDTMSEDGVSETNSQAVKDATKTLADATDYTDADKAIEDAEDKLAIAEAIDKTEDIVASDMVETIDEVDKVVDKTNEDLTAAEQRSQELYETAVESIDEGKAVEAYNELNKVAFEAAAEVEAANKKVSDLENEYKDAKDALANAQKAYNQAIADAEVDANKAATELSDAQKNLTELKKALEAAQKDAEEANKEALEIIKAQDAVKDSTSVDWRKEDTLFIAIMENYFVPQVLEDGAADIKVTYVKGVDNNEYNYFKVTYKDANKAEKTVYYDYAMDGSSTSDILIFEVSKDEVDANAYLSEYISRNNLDKDGKKSAIASGVVSYSVDGEKKYLCGLEVAAMKEAGTVVEIDGKDYILGEAGETIELVDTSYTAPTMANAGAVGSVIKNVEIDEDETVEYVLGEDGKITKVVKADVTTTKYEHKQTKSGYTYSSEKAARDAKDAELADHENVADSSVTITNKTQYQATATYLPAWYVSFSKGNGNMAREKSGGKAVSSYISNLSGQLSKQGYKYESGSFSNKREGYVNFGYEDYWVWGSFTYTKNGVGQQTAESGYFDSEEAAKKELEKVISNQLKNDGISTKMNIDWEKTKGNNWEDYVTVKGGTETYITKKSQVKSETKYAYVLDYLDQILNETEDDATISTTEYAKAAELISVVMNANLKIGNIALDENENGDFNEFISKARTVIDRYADLLEKEQAAQGALDDAKGAVEDLQGQIDELKDGEYSDNVDISLIQSKFINLIREYDVKIAKELNLDEMSIEELEDILDEILGKEKEKLGDAEKKLEDINKRKKIAEESLKRFAEETPGEEEEAPRTPGTPVAPAAPLAAAPAVRAAVAAAPAAAVEETTTIAEPETALAATPEEVKENTELTDIQDTETALAATPINEEHMSWWWLIIVAVLGGTGYALYKKNQEKKAKETTDK